MSQQASIEARLRELETSEETVFLQELKELNDKITAFELAAAKDRGQDKLNCVQRLQVFRTELIDPLKTAITELKTQAKMYGGLAGAVGGVVATVISFLVIKLLGG